MLRLPLLKCYIIWSTNFFIPFWDSMTIPDQWGEAWVKHETVELFLIVQDFVALCEGIMDQIIKIIKLQNTFTARNSFEVIQNFFDLAFSVSYRWRWWWQSWCFSNWKIFLCRVLLPLLLGLVSLPPPPPPPPPLSLKLEED